MKEILHAVEPPLDVVDLAEGEGNPAAQQAAAHGGEGAVDDLQEAAAVLVHAAEDFEIAHGEVVHPHIAFLVDARDGGDVADVGVVSIVKVVENGAGGRERRRHVIHAIAFEIFHLEMFAEPLKASLLIEHPVLQLEGEKARTEEALKLLFRASQDQHLFGLQVGEELVDGVDAAFGHDKFARRDVEQRKSAQSVAEVEGGEKVVFLAGKHVIAQGHTRRDQLGDASLHEFLGEFGVFELVADGNAVTGPNELGQVGVECMMGEARHLDAARSSAIVSAGKGNAQDA